MSVHVIMNMSGLLEQVPEYVLVKQPSLLGQAPAASLLSSALVIVITLPLRHSEYGVQDAQ